MRLSLGSKCKLFHSSKYLVFEGENIKYSLICFVSCSYLLCEPILDTLTEDITIFC
nr:MAG TPA: hypothetical protein [Caudoviricetes sp.]DAE87224.1 MAG TPA: hypothetical protein [Caudoviricetes sp.]